MFLSLQSLCAPYLQHPVLSSLGPRGFTDHRNARAQKATHQTQPRLQRPRLGLGPGSSLSPRLFVPYVTSRKSFIFSDPSGPLLYSEDPIPRGMCSAGRGFLPPAPFFLGRAEVQQAVAAAGSTCLALRPPLPLSPSKGSGSPGEGSSEWPFLLQQNLK